MDVGVPEGFSQMIDPWARVAQRKLIAAIGAGYHRQHNTDDTHSTITATGSISEYNRTLAQGISAPLTITTADFTGSGAGTWTVVPSTTLILSSFIGKRMIVDFNITGSSVAGGGDPAMQFIVSRTMGVKQVSYGTFAYSDNGTFGIGRVVASFFGASGTLIQFNTATLANWAASVNLTSMLGQISFELT